MKKDYLKIGPPSTLADYGWQALKEEIEKQNIKRLPGFAFLSKGIIVTSIAVFGLTSIGFVYASWNSHLGDLLYPVKQISSQIVAKISKAQSPNMVVSPIKESSPASSLKVEQKKENKEKINQTLDKKEKSLNNSFTPVDIKNSDQDRGVKGARTLDNDNKNGQNATAPVINSGNQTIDRLQNKTDTSKSTIDLNNVTQLINP